MEIPAADDVQPKCKQITCRWSSIWKKEQTADKNYWCDNMMEKQVKVPLVFVKLKHEALFCTLT